MHVIGTAGHVDHGKSTLVEALTGIDPDRLREEKERGMTIDLGFAWLELPSGNETSIVDVPGHERLVDSRLAGVGGIDLALLVVAADESVMPQTREHLAILDLLRIERGLVAVTKKDLVDEDWLSLVVADVEDLLKGTTLEGSPVVTVSATTRDGLPELVGTIDRLLQEAGPRKDLGRPRLPIDRAFTMSGFGTVVTGTLIDGRLEAGQEVELVLGGTTTRVRGLQTHRRKLEEATPGSRVAVNLSGVSPDRINRGEVLTVPGWLRPSSAMDVRLSVIPDAPRPVRHNMFVTVHTGSSEVLAQVRLLEGDRAEVGETTWAQLKLSEPLAIMKGDYFVIRSNRATLGGGNIVDPRPRRHRRRHAPILERLAVMEMGSEREILLKSIELSEPGEFRALVNRANLDPADAGAELEAMVSEGAAVALGKKKIGPGVLLYTAAGWAAVSDRARKALEDYYREHPLRKGEPKEEFRSRMGMTPSVFNAVFARLQEEGVAVEDGTMVRLPDRERKLTGAQQEAADAYLARLEAGRFSPPTDAEIGPEILNLLADDGQVVKVSENVVFSASVYQEMVERIRTHIAERGEITVAEVRDLFDTSRKYALALMDHLDHQRITRRVGDARVLR